MNKKSNLTELSNEELKNEFDVSKKLFYPSAVFLVILFVWGIYTATKGKMGFFLIILFLFASVISIKYIEKYGKLRKEMKFRNLL